MRKEKAIDLIQARRSIISFLPKVVEKVGGDALKRLTLRSPSAGNMELYSIIEVKNADVKAELADICDSQLMITKAPLVWVFLADNHKWERYFSLSESDKKTGIKLRKTGLGDMHLCMQDAIIAAHNAAIAAEALGLGSCYIGDVIENYERLQKLLCLPAHAIPAAMLLMVYPSSGKDRKKTPRPPVDSDIFMTDSYKEPDLASLSYQYGPNEQWSYEHKQLPKDKLTTTADYYYNRKYTSSFMEEMNRSAKAFITRWIQEQ